jgi:Uma2 family endonuclease
MTAEELCALMDAPRVDRRLIRGQLIERPHPLRSPIHASTLATLFRVLGDWKHSPAGNGWSVFGYGCPFRLGRNPDTVLCFDAAIVPASLRAGAAAREPIIDGLPTVAVEVVDQCDSREGLEELAYTAVDLGVPLLWLISPLQEIVEVHRPGCGSIILDRGDDVVADFVGPNLRFPVAEIFE